MESNESKELRRQYMREYMKNRYNLDKEKSRNIRNSYRVIKENNISDEEKIRYGHYLADIVKIRKLMDRIPNELKMELCKEIQNE